MESGQGRAYPRQAAVSVLPADYSAVLQENANLESVLTSPIVFPGLLCLELVYHVIYLDRPAQRVLKLLF